MAQLNVVAGFKHSKKLITSQQTKLNVDYKDTEAS